MWACSEKAEVWVRASRISLSCSLILPCIDLPVSPIYTFPHSRGIVKCLYDRAKRLVTKPSVISAEKKHLSYVLVSNGYPSSFVQKISKARTAPKKEPMAEFKSTAVLPYVQGVSEPVLRCLEQQGIRTVFKSETALRTHLVRPKDTVVPAKQDSVVYRIPCECGKVYIGETGRPMHERIKEEED